MFIFDSTNGILTNFDDKSFITQGYSGNGDGLLNPSFQFRQNVGPIPRGKYQIKYIDFTPLEDNKEAQLTPAQLDFLRAERKLGPIVFKLIPFPDNNMGPGFPRSGFLHPLGHRNSQHESLRWMYSSLLGMGL